jgi:hypothetical protein
MSAFSIFQFPFSITIRNLKASFRAKWRMGNKYPPAKPVALGFWAPQRDLKNALSAFSPEGAGQ